MAQTGMDAAGSHHPHLSLLPFARHIFTGDTRDSQYSIGARMHWASKRQTTRVEVEAYCLMGLFDVSMATNYGEAAEAFVRLQYEIMRKTPDLSLFAFGGSLPFGDLSKHGYTLRPAPVSVK